MAPKKTQKAKKKTAKRKTAKKKTAKKKTAKRKTAKRKTAKKQPAGRDEPPPAIAAGVDGELLDNTITLLITLRSHGGVVRALRQSGVGGDAAAAALDAARVELARLAGFDAVEQLAIAIARVEDVHRRSKAVHDEKTALSAIKLSISLRGLDRVDRSTPADGGGPAGELAAVHQYLEPLGLAGPDTPTAELARLAVAELVAARA